MNINEYLRLSQKKQSMLYTTAIAGEQFHVHEHKGDRWICSGEQSILSLMRLDKPADPVLPNHLAMLAALLFCNSPKSVLNLGFGGGTFERFFADRFPTTDIVSVDTSMALVELARTYFQIRQDWPVILQSADDYLQANTRLFDLVLCDIFTGDQHPDCLRNTNFYANTANSLMPGGVMALNLSPATEQELLDILVILRHSFTNVALVTLVDYGNVILFAMQHQPAGIDDQRKRAHLLGDQLQLDLSYIPDCLTILPAAQAGSSSHQQATYDRS